MTFAASATDQLPANDHLWSGAPRVTIDFASGKCWTPTEAQGLEVSPEIRATDNATPPARSTQTVTINVTEVNRLRCWRPWRIRHRPGRCARAGNEGADEDLPRNTLTFSLKPLRSDHQSGHRGVHLVANRGPGASQNNITVRVTDNGVRR